MSTETNRSPSQFRTSRLGTLTIRHGLEVAPEGVLLAIEQHRENHARGREACEHWGAVASVSRVRLALPTAAGTAGPPQGEGLDLAVKWCRWRGVRGTLSDWIYGSRAARSFAGASRLAKAGVLTAEVLAVAERRRFGLTLESFLLTRFLADSPPLPAAIPDIKALPARRRRLAAALGDLVGRLHAAGVDHADFKHSNLLVGPEESIALVDLDSLVPRRRLTWRRRVRALGQLEAYATDLYPWLPRTDRARFLRAYLSHVPELRERRAELVADVALWVARRLDAWARKERRSHIVFPLAPR